MARITPDSRTKVHIVDTIASIAAPTVAELAAGSEVTAFVTPAGIDTPENASDADISSLESRRDFTTPGTLGGDLTGEFYRDDGTGGTTDDAGTAMTPELDTHLVIARFGGTGTDNAIIATDVVEVWKVRVSTRSNSRITRNEALRFVAVYAVQATPDLAAVVAA